MNYNHSQFEPHKPNSLTLMNNSSLEASQQIKQNLSQIQTNSKSQMPNIACNPLIQTRMNSKPANMSIFQPQKVYQTTFLKKFFGNVLLRVLSSHHVGEQLGQGHQTFHNISIIIRLPPHTLNAMVTPQV